MHRMLMSFTLLLMVTLASAVWAQGTNDVYQLSPWSYSPDSDVSLYDFVAVEIINPGQQGTPISANHGTVCADIYLFDTRQEMLECCSCRLTANAKLILNFGSNLDGNPLTGFPAPDEGVLKIISDNQANCDPTGPVPTSDLRAWLRQDAVTDTSLEGPIHLFERQRELFAQVPLQADELTFLGQACSFVQFLGSGKGVCRCPQA